MVCILFDIFGVIAKNQSRQGRTRLEEVAAVPVGEFWEAYWRARPPYDRGEQPSNVYWQAVADLLGVHFGSRQIASLTDADMASWSDIDNDMAAYVSELRSDGRTLGVLSNIPEDLAVRYETRHSWLDVFTVRAFSCRIGIAKPAAAAYIWCAHAFGVPPSDVFFIDDRQENVTAAEAVGMRARLFTSLPDLRPVIAAL
jgi:putative hydrolase of the HAD superfamily